jgi:hypothetical protein
VTTVPAGTVSAPAITTTGDTNTGIFFPAADTIAFSEGGVESMRIDSSGNVGIGTTSPADMLDVKGNARVGQGQVVATSTVGAVGIYSGITSGSGNAQLKFFGKSVDNTGLTYELGRISGGSFGTYSIDGGLSFSTALNNGSNVLTLSERMRIDSNGNLLVGTTTSVAPLTIGKAASQAANGQLCIISPTAGDSNISGMSIIKYANDSSTSQVLMRFLMNQGGTGQGQINANGANTAAFGSYSDSRLKENIVDLPSQLVNIMALRPVEYDYIESMGGGHQIGFVAQEVQAIYPDLVGETEDGMLTLTDMNKNDARLIKAIQEMKAIIDTQASTITQLQADVAALKGASA